MASWIYLDLTCHKSQISCSQLQTHSPRVTKIGLSVSNKKREKDFACLGCAIRQSLKTQHLASHNLPFFHYFVKVTEMLRCFCVNYFSRALQKFC